MYATLQAAMVDMHYDSEKRGIRPKNAFKIILDYIDFCALQKKNVIPCGGSLL